MICVLPDLPPDERQGAYLRTVIRLWYCDDDVCDCAQVRVERVYTHRLFAGAFWSVLVAHGRFYTDGEWRCEAEEIETDRLECELLQRAGGPLHFAPMAIA